MIPIFDVARHFAGVQLDEMDAHLVNRAFGGPHYRVLADAPKTHYTTQGGGYYSARPDLTRSGGSVLMGRFALIAAPVAVSAVGAKVVVDRYDDVIDELPEHEQRSMWQTFASGLTGTFGIGSGLSL